MDVTAVVRVPGNVSPEDAEQLREDFRSIGVEPTFRSCPTSRGPEVVFDSWVWILAVQPFLQHFVEKAAGDAFRRLRKVITKSTAGNRAPETARTVLLKDENSEVQVELEDDLPDEAYRQLSTMDLPAAGRLRWDRDGGRWVDAGDPTG